MADVAVVALELQTQRLVQQTAEAESAFRRLELAGDKLGTASKRNARDTDTAATAHAKAAREAGQYAAAQARLARVSGDYTGAITILTAHLKTLSAASVEYVRVQAQIAAVQAQAGRAARGENFAGFAASLKDINANIKNLPGQIGSVVGRVQNLAGAFGVVSTGALAALAGVSAFVVGLGLGAKKLIDFAVAGNKTADTFLDLSSLTGVSTKTLQEMSVAYVLAGGKVEQARSAIQRFSVNVGQAATGEVPQLEKALKALGVEPVEASTNLEGALKKVLVTLGQSADPAARNAVATALMGREGVRLVTVYRELADKNSDLNREMAKLGVIIDDKVLRAAAGLDDKLALNTIQMQAMEIVIASKLNPALETLNGQWQKLLIAATPVLVEISSLLSDVLGNVAAVIASLSSLPGLKANAAKSFGVGGPLGITSEFDRRTAPIPGAPINPTIGSGRQTASSVDATTKRITDAITKSVQDSARALRAGSSRGGGGSSALPKISDEALGVVNAIEAAARFKREAMGPIVDAIVKAQDDISTQRQILGVKGVAGTQQGTQAIEALRKAIASLPSAVDAFLRASSDALTAANRRVPLAVGPAGVPGTATGLAFGNIPGPGGTSGNDAINKLLQLGPIPGGLSGGIPGQPTKFERDAPRPEDVIAPLKGQIRDAGRDLTQNFLRGVLSGQQSLREGAAGLVEGFSFFFADYASRKLTEYTSKALDKAFDYLGGLIGGLFNKIFSGLGGGGGLGGFIGSLLGFIPGFAGGGYAMAGHPYMVGERGPELFVPRESGYVTPNSQMNGNGGGSTTPVQHITYLTMYVQTPDTSSFKKSQDQILGDMQAKLDRVQRNRN